MAEGPKTQMPARRKARKRALDVLYEADQRDLPPSQVLASYVDRIEKPRPDHMDYAVSLIEGVAKNLDRIDELIASYAEGWTLERMPVADRNLARIAVYELLYVPRSTTRSRSPRRSSWPSRCPPTTAALSSTASSAG